MTLIPVLRKAEAHKYLWVRGQPDLWSEFQNKKSYTEKPCLKKTKILDHIYQLNYPQDHGFFHLSATVNDMILVHVFRKIKHTLTPLQQNLSLTLLINHCCFIFFYYLKHLSSHILYVLDDLNSVHVIRHMNMFLEKGICILENIMLIFYCTQFLNVLGIQ